MKLKTTSKFVSAVLVALSLSSAANAAYISGSISLGGPISLEKFDGVNWVAATNTDAQRVNFLPKTRVQNATGDFDAYTLDQGEGPLFIGDEVTMSTPWLLSSGAVSALWSVGGFTFNLTSSFITQQTSQNLESKGTGIITGNSFYSTPGTWTFNSTSTGSSFGFQAESSAVPDGGTTFVLLGLSLLGLHGARRKFAKA